MMMKNKNHYRKNLEGNQCTIQTSQVFNFQNWKEIQ